MSSNDYAMGRAVRVDDEGNYWMIDRASGVEKCVGNMYSQLPNFNKQDGSDDQKHQDEKIKKD